MRSLSSPSLMWTSSYHWSSSGRVETHIRTTKRTTFPFRGSKTTSSLALSPPYNTMEGPTEELPSYSPTLGHPRASTRSEHRYALRDKNNRDWLSFKVKSRAADSKQMPLFLEGDIIKGEVCLDLARAETLKGLTVTVHHDAVISLAHPHTRALPDSRGNDGCGTGGRALSRHNRAGMDSRVTSGRQGRRHAHTRVHDPHPTRHDGGPGAESDAQALSASADVFRAREPGLY